MHNYVSIISYWTKFNLNRFWSYTILVIVIIPGFAAGDGNGFSGCFVFEPVCFFRSGECTVIDPSVPNAEALYVTFDEQTYLEEDFDFLFIYDGEGNLIGNYTGDQLAGLAAETAQERVAAKVVLSALTLADLREHPVVPYEQDEVTRIIQDDVNEKAYEKMSKAVNPYGDGLACGRIVKILKR